MKGMFKIILITKGEKEYLVSKGVKFGYGGISHTVGNHKTYYLCESGRNKNLLKEYRKKVIAK